ncbi:terminase small subunit [Pantoea septica]|uniref:terminase small subunit n=1 Tax=Pantoea septica TaxID=472695 RepID=UPI000A066865
MRCDLAKLTLKQRRFCRQYLMNFNATLAVIQAGFCEKSARNKTPMLFSQESSPAG